MSTFLTQIGLIWQSLPVLLTGAVVTLQLTGAMLALGIVVGIPLALLEVYGGKAVRRGFVWPVVALFRGIPTLVLLFIVYFGAPKLGIDLSGFAAAVIAIGFRSGIYQSQALRGAILAVNANQMQAARAIGMTRCQAVTTIVLPQALRGFVPALTNEYAVVLKESSLAFALGVTELMRQGRYIVARSFGNSLTIYIACALIYFVLVVVVTYLVGRLERRYAIPGFETASGRGSVMRQER